jgi:hypothetical protein
MDTSRREDKSTKSVESPNEDELRMCNILKLAHVLLFAVESGGESAGEGNDGRKRGGGRKTRRQSTSDDELENGDAKEDKVHQISVLIASYGDADTGCGTRKRRGVHRQDEHNIRCRTN